MTTQRHILITGGAGFIGSHVVDRLICLGNRVTVIDNFDPFYDPKIKRGYTEGHRDNPAYQLVELDILDRQGLSTRLSEPYDVLIHLAAKAGVRPSVDNPTSYHMVNVLGTQNMMDLARDRGIPKVIFASSSSVYGSSPDTPWSEDSELRPISPYAASKIAGEAICRTYSYLYGIKCLALRFFTVFGPRQRPDLAIAKFAHAIKNDQPIMLYGDGKSERDYTYVRDIVDGVMGALHCDARFEIVNIGYGAPTRLDHMVRVLERMLRKKAHLEYSDNQPGDPPITYADYSKAESLFGYRPEVAFEDGVRRYVTWLNRVPD